MKTVKIFSPAEYMATRKVSMKRRITRKASKTVKKMFKKRSAKSYTAVIPQTGRPQRMIAKLVYFTSGQLANSVGVYQTQMMNLNSLYDPDRSGVGHQPLGRDQWATWYNRYRVFKVDYIITFANLDPDQPAIVCVTNANGIPVWTDYSAFEQTGAFVQQLSPRDGGLSRKVVRGSVYLPRLNGKTGSAYKANDDTQAIMSASPAEILTQSLIAAPTLPGSEVNIGYTIKYIYHCELFDPNTLPES